MIFNNADNMMYGDKLVDRVYYGKHLVWERKNFQWTTDRTNELILGYNGVPTVGDLYLNWNQKPINVSQTLSTYALKTKTFGNLQDYDYNIFGDRISLDEGTDKRLYNIIQRGEHSEIFSQSNLYINYNQIDNKSYVEEIGDYAFIGANINRIILNQSSIYRIGEGTFAYFSGDFNFDNILILSNELDEIEVGSQAFEHINTNSTIIFNCSKITLGDFVFNTSNINEVIFNKEVLSMKIPQYAFWKSSLKQIKLPMGTVSIENAAFRECTNLTNITIPNGVTTIGGTAFFNCTELTNITLPSSVTSIGEGAFLGCTSLESIVIPDNVTSIGITTFAGCTSLKNVVIGNSVTSIKESAFSKCTNLGHITIPKEVIEINTGAFSYCTNLTSITILNPECEIYNYGDYDYTIPDTATIYGYENSTAQIYAVEHGINFSLIE